MLISVENRKKCHIIKKNINLFIKFTEVDKKILCGIRYFELLFVQTQL